jgi:hypothetical protein
MWLKRTFSTPPYSYMALSETDCEVHFFSKSLISVSRISSFVGAGGAAGAASSFLFEATIALITRKTAKATIRKSKVTCRKFP